MTIKGSETEKNLLTAFAGESQARNRYGFFASQAKKEGFEQIAAIFEETADQERVHAKQLFKQLEGGELEITAAFPAGIIGTTEENLKAAAEGENEEWSNMYPTFAEVARSEGFMDAAQLFKSIAVAEKQHEARYLKLLQNLQNNHVFERPEKVKWVCRKCGFVHEGTKALKNCPACKHPQAYFQILSENY